MRKTLAGQQRVRRGSTLTEVMVALLISSIGLVAVATLFPMSVLQSVRAAQATSATDLRLNAETAIDLYEDIIKHPDSRNPFYTFPYPNPPAPASYNSNDADPPWLSMQLNGVKNYVVDPLGYATIRQLNLTIGNNPNAPYLTRPEHFYGNDPNGNPAGAPWSILPRYPLTWRSVAAADYLVTLPDSWLLQHETIGGTLGPSGAGPAGFTEITLANLNFSTSLSGNPTPSLPAPTVRLVMFSVDGSIAQTRNVTAVTYDGTTNSTKFQWTEDLNNNSTLDTSATTTEDVNFNGVLDYHYLPSSFAVNTLGKVRVEIQERRYTWMLTIRQNSTNSAQVDVVVFFKRALENIATDERLHDAVFQLGSTQVDVTYTQGNDPTTGLPYKPYMRRGSYVLDANNAFWYRINNVIDVSPGKARLTLEVPANASNNTIPLAPAKAMFPRAVVDVYPIGTKAY